MPGRPIGEDGFAFLDPLIKTALDSIDELSDWQAGFVSNLADRLGRYGHHVFMTGKQWDAVVDIATKLKLPAPSEAERGDE